MIRWQQWLHHPERSSLRNAIFQIHLWIGAIASMYVLVVSVSGSIVVFRNLVPTSSSMARSVRFHTDLLSGPTGRMVNGIGGSILIVLCFTGAIIWWPGITRWRRSITVNWRAHFARISWDLHSAVGFWCFVFLLIWGATGMYFGFPSVANLFFVVDPADRFTDNGLFFLSELHFGRFTFLTQIVWSIAGLAPAVLAFTGVFICCRRVMYKKPSHPDRFVE
jgi:uncharacterized iron-regulated membrane protein